MAIANDEIRILPSEKIDRERWDGLVSRSGAVIYCRSYILDSIADSWDALIHGDYDYAVPLPKKKKWGVSFYYMPLFLPSVTIIGNEVSEAVKKDLLEYISSHVRLFFLRFDFAPLPLSPSPFTKIVARKNYVLPLQNDASHLFANYTISCQKNVRKATQRGCVLVGNIPVETVIQFYRNAYGHRNPATVHDYQKLHLLLHIAIGHGQAYTYGIEDENKTLVFAACILQDNNRIYYFVGAPNNEGRKMRATYFFLHSLVEKNAGKNLVLDFEGSDIPSVAAFYQSFSPQQEAHTSIVANRMCFPLRQLVNWKWKL